MENLVQQLFDYGPNELFNEYGKPLHMDEKYFINFHYGYIKDREQSLKKKVKCMYPGCNKKPILSHSIPKSATLGKIADSEGYVITPKFRGKEYTEDRISINQASVFPGFCTLHERDFDGFEKSGDYRDESIVLQNFRVICKYYNRWLSVKRSFEKSKVKYEKEIFDYYAYHLDKINALRPSPITIKKIADEVTKHIDAQLSLIDYMIAKVHNEDFYPYVMTLSGKEDLTRVMLVEIDVSLPLCIAGKSEFETDGKKYTVHLSLFPSDDKTTLIFSYNSEFEPCFRKEFSKYTNDEDVILFVESWMIYGTDDWFISPFEWNKYSNIKKNRILNELKIEDYYPSRRLDFRIFES
ncbi:hypothetical protein [Vibrio parahaemolyticus]|nr:hypothetical protein [Vibrio parahaemolyticus]